MAPMAHWTITQRGRVVATPPEDVARAVWSVYATTARAWTVTELRDDTGRVVERATSERAHRFRAARGVRGAGA